MNIVRRRHLRMRLSEKTLELNLCAQISRISKQQVIWFGLTQAQEARAGFDVMTRMGGRLILFQFKASNHSVGGARRFHAPHVQLQQLIDRTGHARRSVFYALPLVGTTQELIKVGGDIITNTWLLDVASLPNPFPLPTTNNKLKSLRKSGNHYMDVKPPNVIIHSDPVRSSVINLKQFVENGFVGADGANHLFEEKFDSFYRFARLLGSTGKAAIII